MPCFAFFLDNPLPESTYEFFRLVCSAVFQGIPEYSNYTEASSKRRNGQNFIQNPYKYLNKYEVSSDSIPNQTPDSAIGLL
jgi:hypothetical protein